MTRREKMAMLRQEGHTLAEIGHIYGISRQRVHEILKAAKRDAQRERCARGEHGERRARQAYFVESMPGVMTRVPCVRCLDCGEVIE